MAGANSTERWQIKIKYVGMLLTTRKILCTLTPMFDVNSNDLCHYKLLASPLLLLGWTFPCISFEPGACYHVACSKMRSHRKPKTWFFFSTRNHPIHLIYGYPVLPAKFEANFIQYPVGSSSQSRPCNTKTSSYLYK